MTAFLKRILHRFDSRRKFIRSLPESTRVLDLGCGYGQNGIALNAIHAAAEIHGVDIVRHPDLPGFYSFKTVDLDDGALPFPDNFFDAVLFTHVIEHLRSTLDLGREIHRVMRKGARIYVEAPNWTTVFAPSFGFHREQHTPFNFFDDRSHVKPWSKQGLFEFLFQSCELRVMKVGNTRNWMRIPIDGFIVLYGLLTANRPYVASSFWNVYGWCIYATAIKD